jgi:AbrB family looped-hinge helix DNA binding protein
MNAQTKLSTKGQMVVPAEVRAELGLEPGDILDVRVERDAMVVRRKPTAKKGKLLDLLGPSPYKGPPISVEDMNKAIGEAIVKRYKRSLSKS